MHKSFPFLLLLSCVFSMPALAEGVSEKTLQAMIEQMKALTEEVQFLKNKVKESEDKIQKLQKSQQQVPSASEKKEGVTLKARRSTKAYAAPQKRDDDLQKQIRAEVKAHIATLTSKETLEKSTSPQITLPQGYLQVPGTKTGFKFTGLLKLDTIYDAGVPSGTYSSSMPDLPLKGFASNSGVNTLSNDPGVRSHPFRMTVKQTRLGFLTHTPTDRGNVIGCIEFDFYNNDNFSLRSGPSTLNNYTPRLRQGYFSLDQEKQSFLFGQTWTNFADIEASGTSLEFNNISSQPWSRQPQIKYARKIAPYWTVSGALENSLTDYTDHLGVRRDDGSAVAGSDGFQSLPDLTLQAKYKVDKVGHFSIRGLLRQLRVKRNLLPSQSHTQTAYALGLSGKAFYKGKSSLFAQVNMGPGIGRYIFDLPGQSAAFNPTTGQFRTQFAYGLMLGMEHYWHEKWRSNLMVGQSHVSKASFQRLDVHNPITKRLSQLFLNLIYSPVTNMDIGVEYARFERKAYGITNIDGAPFAAGSDSSKYRIYTGVAHRFQVSFLYRF